MFEWRFNPSIAKLFQGIPSADTCCRFVGGCVRDSLQGITPQDIDIATTYLPQEIMGFLEKASIRTLPLGIDHGSILAVVDGQSFEITTLREDIKTDGRHALVSFTHHWERDARRRDFTMNALYMNRDGEIFDYVGGLEDLKNGRVRFVGHPSDRIQEDFLRILRYFRFYARFGSQEPDPEIKKAIISHQHGIDRLSRERIGQEMLRLIQGPHPWKSIQIMDQWRILKKIFPLFESPKYTPDHMELFPEKHKDFFYTRLCIMMGIDRGDQGFPLLELQKSMAWPREYTRILSHYEKALNLWPKNMTGQYKKESIDSILHFYGKDVCGGVLWLQSVHQGWSREIIDIFEEKINLWHHRPFPLKAHHLPPHIQGPDIGKALKVIEHWWLQENRPDLKYCLDHLSIIDSLTH
jgi:poly(A) polymerase